jgi:hypothetical protein
MIFKILLNFQFSCIAKTIDFDTESNEPGELMELNKYTISNLQVAYVDLR